MKVVLNDISKRYTTHWILKKINHEFRSGEVHSIQGSNGSGKSTLMRIISTQLSPTLGTILYENDQGEMAKNESLAFKISFSAPYILPIENLSLKEIYKFHTTFRSFKRSLSYDQFVKALDYPYQQDQLIKFYSSGMKQRLSLALSILTEGELILLDEPTSYLDENAKKWYHSLLNEWKEDCTVIISTNDKEDLKECTHHLHL